MPNGTDWQMLDDIEKIIRNISYDEYVSISKMMKTRRDIINRNKINEFSNGDKVEFDHNGRILKGFVEKVKIKRVSVRTEFNGLWDIPATLLNFST
tara:strand:+ start:236 stop:523 length:288 start_codon:yes stop_codon:yes gene_type:complete